jgi:hypothetical protein
MIRISGPITVGAVKLKDGTEVLLFGDEHQSKEGLCKECKQKKGCYYITDFLDKLNKKPSELFLESFWMTPEEASKRSSKYQDDVIGNVNNHFFKKMYKHSNKTNKQTKGPIRVHYTDIRTEPNLRDLFKIIMGIYLKHLDGDSAINYDLSLLSKHFKTTQRFKKLLDAMVLSDDYQKSIHTLLKKDSIYATSFVSYKYSNKSVHKIRKQVLKIQDHTTRKCLLKFHKDQCNRIIKRHQEYNEVIERLRRNSQLTEEDESVIFDTLIATFTHIADMYTLARMLSYIEKSEAKVFVSYAGAMHTLHYMMFFMAYLDGSTMIHYQKKNATSRTKRCVSLPKDYVNSIASI